MTKVVLASSPRGDRDGDSDFRPYSFLFPEFSLYLRQSRSPSSGGSGASSSMGTTGSRRRRTAITQEKPLMVRDHEQPRPEGEDNDESARRPGALARSGTAADLRTMAEAPARSDLTLPLPTSITDDSSSLSEDDGSSEEEEYGSGDFDRQTSLSTPSKRKRTPSSTAKKLSPLSMEVDVAKYMSDRKMTKTQEHWNAYTMIPSPLFCLYYILTARWLPSTEDLSSLAPHVYDTYDMQQDPSAAACLSPSWFHSMPSLPPLPVVFVGLAIVLHAPFSFLYHFRFAHRLHHPVERTAHWSRRLDQAMIHVASALLSFATSGSWRFFGLNCLFNADCVYRHLAVPRVKPRANQIRIVVSMLAYTMPIWRQGQDPATFCQVWLCFLLSGWFFLAYPIGGWSHAVFHLVIALAVPLLMAYAGSVPASQAALQQAAWCSGQYQYHQGSLTALAAP